MTDKNLRASTSQDNEEDAPVRRPPPAFVRLVFASGAQGTDMLTPERERALAAQAIAPGPAASVAIRDILAAHEPLLRKMAGRIARWNSCDHLAEDILAEGRQAFIEAIARWNPNAEARLATFARYRVAGKMLSLALALRHPMRVGSSSDDRKAIYNFRAAADAFEAAHGRAPDLGSPASADLGDLAGRLGVAPKAVRRAASLRHLALYDAHRAEIVDPTSTEQPDISRDAVRRILIEAIREAGRDLTPRDRTIVAGYLADPDGFSNQEVARKLSLTPERVGQIRRMALERIRQILTRRGHDFAGLCA